MAWLQQLSNDQQAIVICLGGLLAGWGVLSLSFYTSGLSQRQISRVEASGTKSGREDFDGKSSQNHPESKQAA